MGNSLDDFWANAGTEQRPYIHHADLGHIEKLSKGKRKKLEYVDCGPSKVGQLVIRFQTGNPKTTAIHRSLLPIPYSGDLANARIFLLMANPSLSWSSYLTEKRYEAALRARIAQDFTGCDYPLADLDPNLAAIGGFEYWESRLRPFIEIARKSVGSQSEAISLVARRVAVVERFPYRSFSMPWSRTIEKMPSVQAAKDYVHNDILPRAKNGEVLLVIVRRASQWFDDDVRRQLEAEGDEKLRPFRTVVLGGTNPRNGYFTGDWLKKLAPEFLA